MEVYITGTGQKVNVHEKGDCKGKYCCIHNPSDHHMRSWPTHWRDDRKIMERICPCGVGHPDPDDVQYQLSVGVSLLAATTHGCCGCCSKK